MIQFLVAYLIIF